MIDGEGSSNDLVDDSFISKYIREDNNDAETTLFKDRFKTKDSCSVEVFGSIGEGESFSGGPNSNKWNNRGPGFSSEDSDEINEKKTKFTSNSNSKVKQEFLEELEDDSLTVDTCSRVNHDWKKE